MGANDTLKERIAYGLGASADSPRVDFVFSNVADLLRNKICVLTLSNNENVRAAGDYLMRELALIQNVTKPEAEV